MHINMESKKHCNYTILSTMLSDIEEEDMREQYNSDKGYIDGEYYTFDDYVEAINSREYNDFLENIINHPLYNDECVIIGSIQNYGVFFELLPKKCLTTYDAITKCLQGEELGHKVSIYNGALKIIVYHLYGQNEFTIYSLNDEGKKVTDKLLLFNPQYYRLIEY